MITLVSDKYTTPVIEMLDMLDEFNAEATKLLVTLPTEEAVSEIRKAANRFGPEIGLILFSAFVSGSIARSKCDRLNKVTA